MSNWLLFSALATAEFRTFKTLEAILLLENLSWFTALRIHELDNKDRKSLIAEYKEWILNELDFDEVMMLPYEAYTNKLDRDLLDDLN